MPRKKIRVLVVEDSPLYREYMKQLLETDDQLELCGVAPNAAECLRLMEAASPDIIALDLVLPDCGDFTLLKTLVQRYNTPVLALTAKPELCDQALALGAKGVLKKRTEDDFRDAEQFAMLLKLKLKMYATSFTPKKVEPPPRPHMAQPVRGTVTPEDLIVIGASLGGTETTLEILKDLPTWLPGIVVVQHMAKDFTASYAERLNRNCALQIKEARNGDVVRPGRVLVAKGGEQLTLYRAADGYRVRLKPNDGRQTFCPSVDDLFESAAKAAGRAATAVILTGMGHDGTRGMRLLHDAGAYTIAESEETCVVYGMPRAAVEADAVDAVLPKYAIAEALVERYKAREEPQK